MKKLVIAAKNTQTCESLCALFPSSEWQCYSSTEGACVRALSPSDYDAIIVSTPLSDEFGLDLVSDLRSRGARGIVVLTKGDIAEEVQSKLRFTGAFVIGRPCQRATILQAIHFSEIAGDSIVRISNEKNELREQLTDLKLVNHAKSLLMRYLSLNEEQAHRYIQKQAMDLRKTQREVAEDVLKTYG